MPVDRRNFDRDRGQKMAHWLPQLIAELTTTSTANNWKQPESRIQIVIKIYGATTGHRNSYRYDFEATSEVSVTDCDGHIYIYTYIQTLSDLGIKISSLTFRLGNNTHWQAVQLPYRLQLQCHSPLFQNCHLLDFCWHSRHQQWTINILLLHETQTIIRWHGSDIYLEMYPIKMATPI